MPEARSVGEARDDVLDRLDDETGRRFAKPNPDTGVIDYTPVDRKLRTAISLAMDAYVAAGGDRFDEDFTCTTDATTGFVDLNAAQLLHIRAVLVAPNNDGFLYPITEGDKQVRGPPDNTSRSLTMVVVRTFDLPIDPSPDDLLVGQVSGRARSWPAFDDLVCALAADSLGAKDDQTRNAIMRDIQRLVEGTQSHKREPDVLPWGRRRRGTLSTLQDALRWVWFQREQKLQLFFSSRQV